MEELVTIERSIFNLKLKIEKSSRLTRILFKGLWENRLKKSERHLLEQIDLYLMNHDDEFRRMANENMSMLKGNSIFRVYADAITIVGNYTTRLKGYLHDNGYCYAESTNTNIDILNLLNYAYPAEFSGRINFWGELDLKVSKVKYSSMNASYEFLSEIDENGYMKLYTIKNVSDANGKLVIGRMISQMMDDETAEHFYSNIQKLKAIKMGFREKLKLNL